MRVAASGAAGLLLFRGCAFLRVLINMAVPPPRLPDFNLIRKKGVSSAYGDTPLAQMARVLDIFLLGLRAAFRKKTAPGNVTTLAAQRALFPYSIFVFPNCCGGHCLAPSYVVTGHYIILSEPTTNGASVTMFIFELKIGKMMFKNMSQVIGFKHVIGFKQLYI